MECILMESVYHEPNDETKRAIKEAKSDKYAGTIEMENCLTVDWGLPRGV